MGEPRPEPKQRRIAQVRPASEVVCRVELLDRTLFATAVNVCSSSSLCTYKCFSPPPL